MIRVGLELEPAQTLVQIGSGEESQLDEFSRAGVLGCKLVERVAQGGQVQSGLLNLWIYVGHLHPLKTAASFRATLPASLLH